MAFLNATALLVLGSCSGDKPGAMDDQPAAVGVTNVPLNAFAGGRQTISGLDDGTYSLQFFAKGEGRGYVEANGRKTALTASPNVLAKGFVRGGKAERVCPRGQAMLTLSGKIRMTLCGKIKLTPEFDCHSGAFL